VLELTVERVGDGLEPAVGVVGRALRLPGREVDRPQVVEQEERVEVVEPGRGEGDPDLEPGALAGADRGDVLCG
jgi:hypothetical protein